MSISPEILKLRSRAIRSIRSFFVAKEFVEVETPVRIPAPALEEYIDAPPSGNLYLRTSPELHMKRLLAAGMDKIFQIGPCFREGERGHLHNPEFSMLEWYRARADYMDILDDTKQLIRQVTEKISGSSVIKFGKFSIDTALPWQIITVAEAFEKYAGWNPVENYDADRFDLDLVNKVEPALPRDRAVVLMDYPAAAAALSRRKPDNPAVAERWELYLGGIELANAYSELTDADEQQRRFEECALRRAAAGRDIYPIDRPFIEALRGGLPPCGGIALGVDRLMMLLTNTEDIRQLLPFALDTSRGA